MLNLYSFLSASFLSSLSQAPLRVTKGGIYLLSNFALQQWFSLYKPITYNTDLLTEETDCFVNKLDPSKVFKSKNKIVTPQKKGPVQPTGGQKGASGSTASKSSSGSGNSIRK